MKANDLITVIIPAFNAEKYVYNCVMSVLNQSYKNIEIILVNDGSTDNTGVLCEQLAEKYNTIRVIHQDNLGPSAARNAGLDIAKGKYIGFVDSDDYICRNMYEKLYKLILKYDCEIASCDRYRNINYRNDFENMKANSGNIHIFTGKQAVEHLFDETKYLKPAAWDKLYSKELWEKCRFPVYRYFEDAALTYKLFYSANRVIMTEDQLYAYSVHSGSMITSPWNEDKTECFKKVTNNAILFFEKKPDEVLKQAAIYWKLQFGIEACEKMLDSIEFKQNDYKCLIEDIKKAHSLLHLSCLNISLKKKIKKKIEFSFFVFCPRIFCKIKAIKNR